MPDKKLTDCKIGWIGIGRMGFSMVKRLLDSGCDVTLYNRTRAKAEPLKKYGAKIVDTVKELSGCDIVFTMIANPEAFLSVTIDDDGILNCDNVPKLLVDCSSISEETSSEVRDYAEKKGTQMLAAPVSGNAKVVEAGKLTIVVSGPQSAFTLTEPYLNLMGSGVTYVGEGEQARVVKICHNLLLGVVAQSLSEIIVLAEKRGVSRQAFMEFINDSVMGSMFSRYKTPAFVNLNLTTTFTLPLLKKDLELGLSVAEKMDVSLPLTGLTTEIVNDAIAEGHTDCDFAVLLHQQAKLSNLILEPENVEVDDGLSKAL